MQTYGVSWQYLSNFGLQPLKVIKPTTYTPAHFRRFDEVADIGRPKKGLFLYFRVGSYLYLYLFFLLVNFGINKRHCFFQQELMIDIVRRIAWFALMTCVAFYLTLAIIKGVFMYLLLDFSTQLVMLDKWGIAFGKVRLFLKSFAVLLSFFEGLHYGDKFRQVIKLKTQSLDCLYILLERFRIIVLFYNFFVQVILFGLDIVFHDYLIINKICNKTL